jgi:hypothetical protein
MKDNLQKLIKHLVASCLSEGYYKTSASNPLPIPEVIKRWQQDDKAYDAYVHGWYPINDIWRYREYTWSREEARRSPEEWDELKQQMSKGWDKKDPLLLMVGKNGVAKVGEGNHRLAVAKELNFDKIPVRYVFWRSVTKNPQPPKNPTPVELPKKKEPKAEQQAEPSSSKSPTPEEQAVVDDILDLLMRR